MKTASSILFKDLNFRDDAHLAALSEAHLLNDVPL